MSENVVEALGYAGLDYVIFDNEHSSIEAETILEIGAEYICLYYDDEMFFEIDPETRLKFINLVRCCNARLTSFSLTVFMTTTPIMC